MLKAITLQQVFDQLVREGRLTSQHRPSFAQLLNEPLDGVHIPWFIQGLITLGAWMAASVFLFFIGSLLSFDREDGIWMGTILMVSTIFLHRVQPQKLFLKQFTLVINLIGQVLFIFGFGGPNVFTIALTTLFLELIILVVYWNEIAQFLAVILATLAGLILFYEVKIIDWGIHGVIFMTGMGATVCWLGENHWLAHRMTAKLYQPLGYGGGVALLMTLLLSVFPAIQELPGITWWISTLGLVLLLLMVEYYLLSINGIQMNSPQSYLILGGTLFVTAFLFHAPGIIAAMLIIVLGFQQGHRVLMGLAILFLAVFLVAYYYHLPMTLWMKSMILMGTGLAMLGLYWILKFTHNPFPQNS